MKNTFTLEILPQHQTLQVHKGQCLLDVLNEHAIVIPHECQGKCTCGTCWVEVVEGQMSEPLLEENNHLKNLKPKSDRMRLSCQIRVMGHMKIKVS